jgi:hypothetical protein
MMCFSTLFTNFHANALQYLIAYIIIYCRKAVFYVCMHLYVHVCIFLLEVCSHFVNRDRAVRIATSYWLDDRGVGVRVPGIKNFHFSMSSRPALGSTQSPIQWVPGILSLGVKRPGREADHSLPAGAEVNKMWIYTSTPL